MFIFEAVGRKRLFPVKDSRFISACGTQGNHERSESDELLPVLNSNRVPQEHKLISLVRS